MLKYLSICSALVVFGAGSGDAQQANFVSHSVNVPGADFSIVFVYPKPQAGAPVAQPEQPPSLVVHPTGDVLAYATEQDVERMFKDVGLLQIPIHAFRVERKDGKPANAVNVYIVPNGRPIASLMR